MDVHRDLNDAQNLSLIPNGTNFNSPGISQSTTRLIRSSNFPHKFDTFDDFVVFDRVVNYSFHNSKFFCFVSNMNKSVESKFLEASSNKNCITDMNDDMDVLHRTETWIVTELSLGRKSIGCRWFLSFCVCTLCKLVKFLNGLK